MKRRIAVVTGANRGLGLGTAKELAASGYHVIMAARNEAQLHQEAAELKQKGFSAEAQRLDTSNPGSIQEFSQQVLKDHGSIDVLVNNAGVFLDEGEGTTSALKTPLSKIEATLRTNTFGPTLLIQAFLPSMLAQNYGRVVNVSSGMGQLSEMNGGYLSYRMSKTALNAVTRIFAEEAKGKNVFVNSVCPGWVRTDMGGANAQRSIPEGIAGIVWAATLPDGGPTGGFFRDGKPLDW